MIFTSSNTARKSNSGYPGCGTTTSLPGSHNNLNRKLYASLVLVVSNTRSGRNRHSMIRVVPANRLTRAQQPQRLRIVIQSPHIRQRAQQSCVVFKPTSRRIRSRKIRNRQPRQNAFAMRPRQHTLLRIPICSL